MRLVLVLLLGILQCQRWCVVVAWTTTPVTTRTPTTTTTGQSFSGTTTTSLWASPDDSSNDDDDDNDDNDNDNKKLGIDLSSYMAPMSDQDAAELQAAAREVVNDAVAAGLDDMDRVRQEMKQELAARQVEMQRQSEQTAELASQALLERIDALTQPLLQETQASRAATKLAAQADQAMTGRGVDMGTWGTLGGATVVTGTGMTDATTTQSTTLSSSSSSSSTSKDNNRSNRLLILANVRDDDYAKQLVEPLSQALTDVVAGLQVEVVSPTSVSWPLGGNQATAVLVFLTSLNNVATLQTGLERVWRSTLLPAGQGVVPPPSQLIALSTLGTSRTNQMPYSMQNMWGGGKLAQRQQMEEVIQTWVEQKVEPRPSSNVDYTICKLGSELKAAPSSNNKAPVLTLTPDDVLDGSMDVDTAVQVLQQAIALQPAARNATLGCVGTLSPTMDWTQDDWDDLFLPLQGPEVWRSPNYNLARQSLSPQDVLDQLIEYMYEWSQLDDTSKGLTTPIRIEWTSPPQQQRQQALLPNRRIVQQTGLQFLFQPTATGARYMSRSEEKQRERDFSKNNNDNNQGSSSSPTAPSMRPAAKEGGLEICMEWIQTNNNKDDETTDSLRVRVRRCNYAPGVILKELTEQSLVSRIEKALTVWEQQHFATSS